MFIPQSSFIVLYTSNVEKTAEFYRSLNGNIKQHEVDKVVVVFDLHEFHFILDTTEPFEAYRYIAKQEQYGQGIIFYIGTTDIEAVYTQVKEAGGQIKAELFTNKWNAREFLFEDPNGYKIAIYQEL